MTPIVLHNINKSYGTLPVLVQFSITLPPGNTNLMGTSGIGKTTLAFILAKLTAPDGGTTTGLSERLPAMVFQEDRLLEHKTVLQNLLFVKPDPNRAVSLLTQAGLAGVINKKTATLSGGMKRRVAVCRALLSDHDLLILDEPFKGLDEITKPTIINMVRRHIEERPFLFSLCITHDPAEAEAMGGRLVVM